MNINALDETCESYSSITTEVENSVPDASIPTGEEIAPADLPQLVRDLPADVTPVDVAQALVELHRINLRFDADAQLWYTFTPDGGWRADRHGYQMTDLVKKTLRTLSDLVPEALDTTKHRRFAKTRRSRTRSMETDSGIKGVRKFVEADTSIHCESSDIDSVAWAIGTPDGIVDLRSGARLPFARNLLITRRSKVCLEPTASCDRWERFLREVLGDDEDTQNYFQQLVGYLLTGETREQQMWLLVGSGSNGKSTLLHVLQRLLGDYVQQSAESVLLGRPSAGGATNDLVRLKGIRCALLAETAQGQCFNEERVKGLVASDTVTARGLYKEYEEFIPQAKFLLATNHLPVVRGVDEGIWRRLVVVNFKNRFEVGSDPTLFQDLVDELPGIFAWAVRGAVRWYDSSLDFIVPSDWSLATNQYRATHDAIKPFVDNRVRFENGLFVEATDLYLAYKQWCDEDGRQPLSQGEFGRRFMATGHVTKDRKGKENHHTYFGAGLRRSPEAEIVAKLDGLFDDQSTSPSCPSLHTADGPLMEVTF